jgi:ketosteroid isomerase-like protein
MKEIALKFIEAINNQDLHEMIDLMAEDHVFIDASGSKFEGKKGMAEGWEEYFRMFPDYNIEVTDVIEGDGIIGIFGYASGTYLGDEEESGYNYWEAPASWKVKVKEGKIRHWQVYCDYSELFEIIGDIE